MATPTGSRGRVVAALGVALLAGMQLLPWAGWSVEALASHGMFRDDALFFAVLAENFAQLGFLTFDGVQPTNGVQPLWMWVLLALKALFPHVDSSVLLARASFATYVSFAFVGGLWACRGPAIRAAVSLGVFSALILLNPAFQFFAVRGLETPLLLLLLMAFLLQLDRLDEKTHGSVSDGVWLAVLGALCFLARTNLFWLSIVGWGWLAWRSPRPRAALATYAGTTAALVLPYLSFNAIAFGSAMPISGRVKRYYLDIVHPTLADYLESREWFGVFSAFAESVWVGMKPPMAVWAIAVLLVLVPLLVLAIRELRVDRSERRVPQSLGVLALASTANLLLMYGWYRELRPYSSYYFAAEVVFAAAMCAWLLRRARSPGAVLAACAALVLVTSVGRFASGLVRDDYWTTHLAAVEDVRALPPEATVGAYWPGALGALSGRPILPLDGIIGSPEYFDDWVRSGRDLDWLLAREQPHLAIYLHRSPEALLESSTPPPIPRWNRLGELRLWSRRDCGPLVRARHPRREDGTGWYVFAFDPVALERCRVTHGIGDAGSSST